MAQVDVVEVATSSYFNCMRAVGIKSLKNRLSEYIRLVKAGEPLGARLPIANAPSTSLLSSNSMVKPALPNPTPSMSTTEPWVVMRGLVGALASKITSSRISAGLVFPAASISCTQIACCPSLFLYSRSSPRGSLKESGPVASRPSLDAH